MNEWWMNEAAFYSAGGRVLVNHLLPVSLKPVFWHPMCLALRSVSNRQKPPAFNSEAHQEPAKWCRRQSGFQNIQPPKETNAQQGGTSALWPGWWVVDWNVVWTFLEELEIQTCIMTGSKVHSSVQSCVRSQTTKYLDSWTGRPDGRTDGIQEDDPVKLTFVLLALQENKHQPEIQQGGKVHHEDWSVPEKPKQHLATGQKVKKSIKVNWKKWKEKICWRRWNRTNPPRVLVLGSVKSPEASSEAASHSAACSANWSLWE